MKVLVVCTNRHRNPVPVMPLGACLVAEAAEAGGHRVRVLDLMHRRDPMGAVRTELTVSPPDVIGISVRNIDNHDMKSPRLFFDELVPLVKMIRLTSRATLVMGGSAVGIMPEECLRRTGAGLGIAGNAEYSFPDLLARLEDGGDLDAVPGVLRLRGGVFSRTPPDTVRFSPRCSVPDFARWIDTGPYRSSMATVPLQTKRGCPFGCVYCTYSVCEGSDYRLCTPDSVAAQVERLGALGVRDVEFADNVFNAPYGHALAVCRAIAARRPRVRLHTLELNPGFVDAELLASMEEAGFASIGITAESADDRVLAGLGKAYSVRDLERAAAAVAARRLPCLWMFMLGGPGETEETVAETFRFARERVRRSDVALFNPGVRIYPGTRLEGIARRDGVLDAPVREMFEPVSYVSPLIRRERLLELLARQVRRQANFIDLDVLGLPFLPHLYRAGKLAGMRPPLWRYASPLRRLFRTVGVRV